ncbi:alpha/beta hydrolase-fold protein [Blastopirellula marina]|uniref:Peptidase n=1 Tax=Blastopirellula marina TaxID=124 RepID=A0A2S8GE09_9BACT|nr:alpha/beta hydrolase-fold protein [Blastopirellula marina]PQO42698.1 peptidase [Blastopirellula marina]PTL46464.1 peptidase [Blastopirellula marina]
MKRLTFSILALGIAWLSCTSSAWATVVEMKNGMRLEGSVGKIASMSDDPLKGSSAGAVDLELIVLIDNDLKRTFVPTSQVQDIQEAAPISVERIKIDQRVADSGRNVHAVGEGIRITPFDEFGRRIYSMQTAQGPIDVIQGITEITPDWTRVQGLMAEHKYVWDMRIKTSSIPRDKLSAILMRRINPKDSSQRLQIVRLYLQANRYRDAAVELNSLLNDFPELNEHKKHLNELWQLSANNLIDEVELRKETGQHNLAYGMLNKFPSDNVASSTLLKVSSMLTEYQTAYQRRDKMFALLKQHQKEFADATQKAQVDVAIAEIEKELNINNMDRLGPYLRLSDDPKLTSDEKLSLAISGWIIGANDATENIAVALSVFEARDLVSEYITNKIDVDRRGILEKLKGMEGGAPAYVAKIMQFMKPPLWNAEPETASEIPGYYLMRAAGVPGHSDFFYYVQLPQGYDPYRKYPTVVTLHGAGTTAEQQIDWWSGSHSEKAKIRMGQAARQGYIVIAPMWAEEHQYEYNYSAFEHASVLFSLRDALRHFSIDTDRVFLSGHSMGGDAAWDIGLAHPDLWAGVIPIVAKADKYVARYWENARNVPLYFVGGELDGNKREQNARDYDRYLTKIGFDATIVEYRGRGHEHFQDEIQDIFTWMNLHKRNFFPKEFEVVSMRPWDNFFYWLEVSDFPERSLVLPSNYPEPKKAPVTIESKVLDTNGVRVDSGTGKVHIYLTPDLVNFDERITVSYKGRNYGAGVEPSTEVMLEDGRTRADRLHPFWAKIDTNDR